MKKRAILAGAATIPAFVIATQLFVAYRVQGIPLAFAAAFAMQLCHWELWAIAGPIAWSLERRWPLTAPHRMRSLLRHAGAGIIIAGAVLASYYAAYHALVRIPGIAEWFAGFDISLKSTAILFFVAYFHVDLMIYAALVAVAHASRASALLREREHEALRLEAALTAAKLTTLRTQLQPHFLFNTLHTIGSLVLQGQNRRAVELLAELGELLRGTLAHRNTDLAPLGEEVGYLRRYLRIEEARFGDRLRVQWTIDPAATAALVPPFILQPLVENAFRHGIARLPDAALLDIAASLEDGALRVTIYNDGPALPEDVLAATSSGYGLKNVEQRLKTRAPAGRLELRNAPARSGSPQGGVCATLTVPLWQAEAAAV